MQKINIILSKCHISYMNGSICYIKCHTWKFFLTSRSTLVTFYQVLTFLLTAVFVQWLFVFL